MLLYVTIAAVIFFVGFFIARRRQLNRAPEQHHLASMMVAALTQESTVKPQDVSAWVNAQGWSASRRSVRVSHALRLAQANVPTEHQATLLDLARRLISTR
jgi:uncharacterized protein YjcR